MNALLYSNDVLPIITVCLAFMLTPVLHKLVAPDTYGTVLEVIYQPTVKRAFICTSIRIISIILLSCLFRYFLGITSKQITTGVFIGSFLIIWPAFVQFKLVTFFTSKAKTLCLVGYTLFCGISVFSAWFTTTIIYPMMFEEVHFFIFSNDGMNLILSILSLLIPVSIETLFSLHNSFIRQDLETFSQDVKILGMQVEIVRREIGYENEIKRLCKWYNVNTQLIEVLLSLEKINRGQWYTRLLERIICRFFTGYAIERDFSVGLAQIKISTAKLILQRDPRTFINKLLRDEYSINVCCRLISSYISEYSVWQQDNVEIDIFSYIAMRYLCEENDEMNRSVMLYSVILSSMCDEVYYTDIDDLQETPNDSQSVVATSVETSSQRDTNETSYPVG